MADTFSLALFLADNSSDSEVNHDKAVLEMVKNDLLCIIYCQAI